MSDAQLQDHPIKIRAMKLNHLLKIAAAAISGSAAGIAQAQGGTNFTIHNELGHDHFCMDASMDSGVHDGSAVYVYRCHGRENQRWTVTQSVDNQSAIVGINGFCLDVRGASRAVGTPVQLYQCHFGGNQKFVVQPDGHIRESGTGKCLSSLGKDDRAPIVLDFCQDTRNQIWLFEK